MFNSSTVKLRLSTDELAVYSDLHTTCIIYKSSSLLLLGLLTFGVSVASLVAASFLGSGSGSGWTVRLRSVGGAGALQMLSIAAASSPVAAIFSTHDHMTRAVSRDFSFPSFFLMQWNETEYFFFSFFFKSSKTKRTEDNVFIKCDEDLWKN